MNMSNGAISKIKTKATLQKIFGWILALFWGLILAGAFATFSKGDAGFIIFVFILFALGIFLIIKGSMNTKLLKHFQLYAARTNDNNEIPLDSLAVSVGMPLDQVAKEINRMISCGLFQGWFLDAQRNCLVRSAPQASMPMYGFPPAPSAPFTAPTMPVFVTVQCKGCGAVNKIASGSVCECEFCGAQISE